MLWYCERPYEGELLYGYALRLFRCGAGIGTLDRFMYDNFGIGFEKPPRAGIRCNLITNAERVVRENAIYRAFPDIPEIIFRMTPIGSTLTLLRFSQQVRMMESVLHRKHNFLKPPKTNKETENLKICPDCLIEDIEKYDEAYYHAEHHIPMMNVCSKHGRPLVDVPVSDAELIWTNRAAMLNDLKEETVDDLNGAVLRSRFLHQLYETPVYMDSIEIMESVREKVNTAGIGTDEAYGLIRERYGDGCHIRSADTFGLMLSGNSKNKTALIEAAETWLDMNELSSRQTKHEEDFLTCIKGQYEMASDFGSVVKLKCKEGHVFYTHPYAVMMGIGCPVCDEEVPEVDFANRLLSHLGDGNYHTEVLTKKMKDAVVIHDTCGASRNGLTDIIFGERKCKCEMTNTIDGLQKIIDRSKKEFIIKSFVEDPSGKKIRVQHKKCGQTFDIKPVYFLRKPVCRICDPKGAPEVAFDNDLRNLTGDDYVRFSPYKGYRERVKILHRDCGTWFETTPAAFRSGCRCPLCMLKGITVEYLKKSVHDCTDGLYEVVKAESEHAAIIMTPDGNMLKKARRFIIQELERPTPSDLFQYRARKPEHLVNSSRVLFDHVMASCRNNGKWVSGNVPELNYYTRRDKCRWLAMEGYIKRISRGVYVPGERVARTQDYEW